MANTKIKIENVSKKYDVENKALLFTKGNSAHDNFVGHETDYVLKDVNLAFIVKGLGESIMQNAL